MAKIDELRRILSEIGSCAVAYSGGADSAFLADIAHEVLGERAIAVTAVSESLAPIEREQAAALARRHGWRHTEIVTREMDRDAYRANEPDRCYHCKTELFEVLDALGPSLGVDAVLVGTNTDDTGDFRPGQRAARERGVRAPLLEAGLSKDEIRALSRERGLPTWDKPASACLASRVAYGIEVTPERLDRIARAEELLRSLGLRELRVRDHGDLARIEVPAADIALIASDAVRERLAEGLRALGFVYVTLDLEGFASGSMNRTLLRIGRPAE